jgi:hypothetical protein
MGLDQFAGSQPKGTIIDGESEWHAKFTWRKHPNLQGWMEQLWISKGLKKTDKWNEFNCCPVELSEEDIICLKMDVESQDLPETTGFFFGDDSDKHYKDQDLEFCKWALEELKTGNTVVYDSWW